MTDWQQMAFWPPKKKANGEEFLFWQPWLANGRIVLEARAVISTCPPGGPRETTAWARIDPPKFDDAVARERLIAALRKMDDCFYLQTQWWGPRLADERAEVLSLLKGSTVPMSRAGFSAFREALYEAVGGVVSAERALSPNAVENAFAKEAARIVREARP